MSVGQTLFITASTILASLGLVHGVLLARDLSTPRFFTPTDERVRAGMAAARLRLAPQTSIWLAWQGFNVSHSLGLVGLGLVGIVLGTIRVSLGSWKGPVDGFFILVAAVYFVLALRFWFRTPAIGTGLAAACFVGAFLLD